jgi:hypothetical protein
MGTYAPVALILALPFLAFSAEEAKEKWQITYLAKSGKLAKALDLYEQEVQKEEHDFELLEQLGLLLLEQGARSQDPQRQLASIYGAHLAGIAVPIDVLEEGVRSKSPETQLACIQTLASFQDDRGFISQFVNTQQLQDNLKLFLQEFRHFFILSSLNFLLLLVLKNRSQYCAI